MAAKRRHNMQMWLRNKKRQVVAVSNLQWLGEDLLENVAHQDCGTITAGKRRRRTTNQRKIFLQQTLPRSPKEGFSE
jgi:hypothetical protein